MKELNYIDELTNYLKSGDKENFSRRYPEIIKEIPEQGEEYIELQLLNFTYGFLFEGDFEKLLLDIEKLEPLIDNFSNDIQKIRFLVNKGIVLGRLNQTEEAIKVYNSALVYCNTDDRVSYHISILTNIGVIFFRKNNFVKSLKHLLTAYGLNKKFNCQVKLTSLLVNIGVIYLHLETYEKAIYYFELSLKTMTNSREYAKLSIYNNLITAYSASCDFSNARRMIDLCLPEKVHFSKSDEINLHKALALFYSKQKDYTKAIDEYKSVINSLQSDKFAIERIGYKIALAKVYLDLDKPELCKEIIAKIDLISKYDKDKGSYSSFLELKVRYHRMLQDYKTALQFSDELNKLQAQENKTLEEEIVSDLTIHLSDEICNISKDAYDDKILELEETNKELNEQTSLLIHSLNDLRNESKLREKIISIISHDIRAPIGNIIQLLEILDEYEDKEERDEVIIEVLDAMKQTYSLTNELVDWAKEIINVHNATLSYINFKEIVNTVELLYRQQLDSKHIVIINDLSEDRYIFSHEASMKTCFRNIIQNAIKYSDPYSKIEIKQIVKTESVTYTIKDYGRGISPEEVENLFDVSKISTLGTNQESGIGIGLLLVKELINKNKGQISCESTLGEGTTFYFTFPININDRLNYLEITSKQ